MHLSVFKLFHVKSCVFYNSLSIFDAANTLADASTSDYCYWPFSSLACISGNPQLSRDRFICGLAEILW